MATLTLNEFLQRQETKPASEYACGRVLQKPMPTWDHSAIQLFVGVMLYQFLARTGIGRAATEFRCIFGPPTGLRTYVPDISYVARERLTGEPYLHGAPDLAIEILSPGQHLGELLSKVQFYLLYGVRLVWIIDPSTSTVTVEEPAREPRVLSADDVLDGGDVLPGFTLAVGDIFAQTRV